MRVDEDHFPVINNEAEAVAVTRATRLIFAAAPHTSPSQIELALLDLVQGARMSYLWGRLGLLDIRQRYRRSVIGPFWLTLSMAAMVGSLGVLYAGLFKVEVSNYLPFMTLGIIVWGLVSGLITDGCISFIGAEGIIKQIDLPLSIHVYRTVWRNFIILGHNVIIFAVVAMVFSIWPGWIGLLALPGLVLLGLNGVWVGMLLGLISARFRDLPQVMTSIVQLAFFFTPILWKPELLPDRAWVVDVNPFFHVIELVRAPLLGQFPGVTSWLAVFATTFLGSIVTFVMYCRYRWRIAYWI